MQLKVLGTVAAILLTCIMPSTSPALATVVNGQFSGVVYQYNSNAVDLPIFGTFSYDTDKYTQVTLCDPFAYVQYCSLFGASYDDAVTITETVNGQTLTFGGNDLGGQAFFVEKYQIEFGAESTGFSNYTTLDMIFPEDVFTLGAIPVSYSATFVPFQGSSQSYFGNGQSFAFYVTDILAAPVSEPSTPVPEPSTWIMMIVGFCGLGYMGFRQSRRRVMAAA
jgi:hypothetical protein